MDFTKEKAVRFIVGKNKEININAGDNGMSAIIGPPGCGKSFYVGVPNILLNQGESFVIDDKKGSLYAMTGKHLEEQGYEVKVINLVDYDKSDFHFNIFEDDSLDIKEIHKIVHYLYPNCENSIEPFWPNAAKDLLSSLVGIGHECYNQFNLRRLMEMLTEIPMRCMNEVNPNYDEDPIDALVSDRAEYVFDKSCYKKYKNLRSCAGDTWRSILVEARANTEVYNDENLFEISDKSTFDFCRLGRQKTAIFIVSSDTDSSLDPFVQLIYNSIFNKLVEYADTHGGRLKRHVRFILDDLCSGVAIPDFDRMIANCRSRNISFLLSFQSRSQLSGVYGSDKAMGILDCIPTRLYFPSANYETQKYLSEILDTPISEIQKMKENEIVLEMLHSVPTIIERYENPGCLLEKEYYQEDNLVMFK